MTIEYALTRGEIVRGFFRSLTTSSRFRLTVLLYAAFVAVVFLVMRTSSTHRLTLRDLLTAVACGLGLFLFLPLWLFIRGKTAKRIFTSSPEGIYTEIGKIKGQIPWSKVKIVAQGEGYVLIARLGGNAFFIPDRAFSNVAGRQEFLAEIERWMKAG